MLGITTDTVWELQISGSDPRLHWDILKENIWKTSLSKCTAQHTRIEFPKHFGLAPKDARCILLLLGIFFQTKWRKSSRRDSEPVFTQEEHLLTATQQHYRCLPDSYTDRQLRPRLCSKIHEAALQFWFRQHKNLERFLWILRFSLMQTAKCILAEDAFQCVWREKGRSVL